GARSIVREVKPNREYEIREPPSPPGLRPGSVAAAPAAPAAPVPWFRDVSSQLAHRHMETPFNDWARQPLLPEALSQLGPGVTWYDVDGDGDEDLLIASGRGGPLAYYRNDGGRFTRVDLHAGAPRYDETAVLPLRDGAGGPGLRLGQSGHELRRDHRAPAARRGGRHGAPRGAVELRIPDTRGGRGGAVRGGGRSRLRQGDAGRPGGCREHRPARARRRVWGRQSRSLRRR